MFVIMFVICVVGFLWFTQACTGPDMGVSMAYYLDTLTLVTMLLILLPMMVVSGTLKDFFRACSIVNRPRIEYTVEELKKAKIAVDLSGKLVLVTGALQAVALSIIILATLSDPNLLGPNMAVMLISLLYALIPEVLILPMGARLRKMIIEQTQREEERKG